jgi:hypothetical protein
MYLCKLLYLKEKIVCSDLNGIVDITFGYIVVAKQRVHCQHFKFSDGACTVFTILYILYGMYLYMEYDCLPAREMLSPTVELTQK